MRKVALITGASSGIGAMATIELRRVGYTVYAAARNLEKMDHLEVLGIKIVQLDVTNEDSIEQCINTIIQNEGRIDVLVNNAGYGSYGSIEDVPLSEARRQFDVNVFGLARLTQLVLPHMRAIGSGRIINISSVAGKCHTPFGGWYHATKFAVEGLSDSLRLEVEKQFGIKVVIIEPGAIKTPWGAIAADHLENTSKDGAYEQNAASVSKGMRKLYTTEDISSPLLVARTIRKAVVSRRPRTRYVVGAKAFPLLLARRVLPDRLYDRLMRWYYNI